MAKTLINPASPSSGFRLRVGDTTPKRSRQIIDPAVAATIDAKKTRSGRRSARKKGINGTIPDPLVNKANRKFIGIEPGCLVSVQGHFNTKFVVVTEPSAKFMSRKTGEVTEVKSLLRRCGRAVVSVTLMGPDNTMIEVPVGWCKPLHV